MAALGLRNGSRVGRPELIFQIYQKTISRPCLYFGPAEIIHNFVL